MLYDPKWEQKPETKADPLSLESMIAWLEKQPSEASYPGTEAQRCLLAQWLKSSDPESYCGGGHSWTYMHAGQRVDLRKFNDIVLGDGARTFGAALERARALAAR